MTMQLGSEEHAKVSRMTRDFLALSDDAQQALERAVFGVRLHAGAAILVGLLIGAAAGLAIGVHL